jgi:ArsR family transcriptional regulator
MRKIENENKAVEVFGALSDKTRLNIVQELMDGEKPCSELILKFNISKSTFSHHAKILARCGLVKFRREGKFLFFSLDRKYLENPIWLLIKSCD